MVHNKGQHLLTFHYSGSSSRNITHDIEQAI
ncbi:hypothetical protein swp_1050 [Shewanella piezotolerans WP3]|uniref:Uncharacterized protein n=1 Tax=Shewanella piezotolerans (strain WP3 / JCM 13877) TaxID=225849 RepID=B8CJ90_SHEPW|nr:hypothetical protein swp_1050 [Shewanella piezotolerans WP3]